MKISTLHRVAKNVQAPLLPRFGAFMGWRLNFSVGREYAHEKVAYTHVRLHDPPSAPPRREKSRCGLDRAPLKSIGSGDVSMAIDRIPTTGCGDFYPI